ncbi:MAG: hypothetical protein II215_05490 [Paludibacteraceae bacterium]|jgi:hypothetical protein|nr:hypothetical protein [Paludibacteraceae bacterium]MED9995337.1 hypothetical protein [Paludibacteraceae bacterium]
MDAFFEILKYTIPALLVLAVVWVLMNKFFQQQESRQRYLLYKENQKNVTPIRFTAYERLVLFLERITPDSLLVRTQSESYTAIQLHSALLTVIRAEYEHNVAQQVYVSEEAWEVVKNAKESIVQLINACAAQVDPQGPSINLVNAILATYEKTNAAPTMVAVSFLKTELKTYFSA